MGWTKKILEFIWVLGMVVYLAVVFFIHHSTQSIGWGFPKDI
jgi:hypothetical protein